MVNLVCPHCATSTTAGSPEEVKSCPRCGSSLQAAVSVDEPDAVDGLLVADLREALGFGMSGPVAAAVEWPPARAGGSTDVSSLLQPATLASHTRLGDFEILRELGRGGMGVVYRARQVSLGREVALKVLPGYARHGESAVQRFRAEAQAAARIHHTNVVSIYAQGEHNGHFYYAMELIDGVGLDTVIRSRPDLLSTTRLRALERAAGETRPKPTPVSDDSGVTAVQWTRADYRHIATLFADVADALECAHRQGVIHRDVKPHNLLLGTSDADLRFAGSGQAAHAVTQRLHVTDFGLARLTDAPHLTASGEVMGTPAYLSPEQIRGHPGGIDHRTDIYSLGVTLYEVLTRSKPFGGETREQMLAGICSAEPKPLRRRDPHVPADLETICLRALEKEPGRRQATAALLAEDLRRFAEGRPILSRRTSRLVKAGKWVRRHKAVTTALTAVAAVLILAGGWIGTVGAARHREAQQLLDAAYAQFAYYDFRNPKRIEPEIERAARLGADVAQLHLVRALAAMGDNDPPAAIRHLQQIPAQDASDLRARYLLSWAQYRNRELSAARETFAQAEQLRSGSDGQGLVELTPDAWFFRGLAVHFTDPAAAIESYREANALRARQHAFYPQAVLNLARARNQQLYSTRTLDAFPEAAASLRQLVDQGYYEAYPYYLLSIAHRLAAEIYTGSENTRGDQPVVDHYAQALEWARRGQQAYPTDDRPISAEAECLESMGQDAEAIVARTRAIAVADAEVKRCEGFHYRWRLYYWTGDLEAALGDVTAHAACDPQSRFYAHVYPALIQAERGDLPAALAHARALAADAPGSAQAVLWSATCLRLLGQPEEAAALLASKADTVDYAAELVPPQTAEWVRALYAFCREGGELTALDPLAQAATAPWKLSAEAYFHAAALRLAAGDRVGALAGFQQAYRSFDGEERYTYHAKLICVQMQKNMEWPPWITVSWKPTPGGSADLTAARPVVSALEERTGP